MTFCERLHLSETRRPLEIGQNISRSSILCWGHTTMGRRVAIWVRLPIANILGGGWQLWWIEYARAAEIAASFNRDGAHIHHVFILDDHPNVGEMTMRQMDKKTKETLSPNLIATQNFKYEWEEILLILYWCLLAFLVFQNEYKVKISFHHFLLMIFFSNRNV